MAKSEQKTITIIGAGYVGLPTAALFAYVGHKVYVLDVNEKRLAAIRKGKSFFYEQGLDPIVSETVTSKRLIPTNSYEQSVPASDIIFSCVGTPDNPDGSSNLSYVFGAAESALKLMRDGAIYVQKSTVPVGTGREIIDLFENHGRPSLAYLSNPEFLREGTALSDSLFFDRIVVGGENAAAINAVMDLYKSVEARRLKIAEVAGIKPEKRSGSYIKTNLDSAELIKVTANAFLALKISFANSIARLADVTGADITEVMDAVGADRRIGRAFLNAGRGYGGGCFPKDVSGLISSAAEHGVDLAIMTAATEVNESMPGYIANKAQEALGDELEGKKVAVLGLAFKAGTSDARRSPGVKLANILDHSGARVTAYDPEANDEAQEDLRKGIRICGSLEEAVKATDAVFITTDWAEFVNIDLEKLRKSMSGNVLIDSVNSCSPDEVSKAGLYYVGVGR